MLRNSCVKVCQRSYSTQTKLTRLKRQTSCGHSHIAVSNSKYIRQMKAENCIHFKQILAATDFSPVLACECPNVAYNKLICEYENAFNIALPTKRIKLLRKYIKREPWMTQGLLNSSLNKSKFLRTKKTKPKIILININTFAKCLPN